MIKRLKIKVCGMKYPDNRMQLESLPVDFFGFIFYRGSSRFAGNVSQTDFKALVNTTKNKVGVFVNELPETVLETAEKAALSFVQLHGDESPEYCNRIRSEGLKIIKAFRVDEMFSFNDTIPYQGVAEFFLFDTKGSKHGGTGMKFNWEILEKYKGEMPFFLSGGIAPDDVLRIKSINHPRFFGIDLNSGFEDAPGLKNVASLAWFFNELFEDKNL